MKPLFSLDELEAVFSIVRQHVPETPAFSWPLLNSRTGMKIVVKHENHTPIGAFKARSCVVYAQEQLNAGASLKGFVSATRGNHGQSVALAARALGIPAMIVVPEGNAEGKNRAMRALGAQVIVHGRDFDISRTMASELAMEHEMQLVPSFDRSIVLGVATYALEFFRSHPDLDVVYVPVGMGSGACALITVRDLLGLKTEIVPVVSEHAPAFKLSFEAGKIVHTETAATFADGMACRQPLQAALDIILGGVERMVSVSDDQIAEAIRILFADTHNLVEGAGAAALAGCLNDPDRKAGQKTGIVLTGGNIDEDSLKTILSGATPQVA